MKEILLMTRAYAVLSSLCLSPALFCSLGPNAAPEVLSEQAEQMQKVEAVVTQPSPSAVEIPNTQTETPIIEAVITETDTQATDDTNDYQESDIESDEALMMKSDPQNATPENDP
jgi:hypothetical protein